MDNQIIIAIISSSALSALIGGIVTIIGNHIKEKKNDSSLLMQNTAISLWMLGNAMIQNNHIDKEALKLFLDTYKLYKDKKGNGYIDYIYGKVVALPLIDDDND